ncbi:MAG: cell division protein ZapA [Rhodospirillaceae bacterium]|jgi:cell division protein ZapA|nr:cell division protein ZapA [Rhodospirillaceae bacterium]
MIAKVNIKIGGRNYEIGCDEGQEQDVHALAIEIDRRIEKLLNDVGQIGDSHLLVMAGLMMVEEIYKLQQSAEKNISSVQNEIDSTFSTKLNILTQQINTIADYLEKTYNTTGADTT